MNSHDPRQSAKTKVRVTLSGKIPHHGKPTGKVRLHQAHEPGHAAYGVCDSTSIPWKAHRT